MAGYTGSKEDHLRRLRRIEGQVRGISHMNHCVLHAAQSSDAEGRAKIREASDAIARLVKS